jgi:5-methylcytosine-specific restriction enzyme subunit McrC
MATIYEAREREVTTIPIEEILRNGQIDIIPEVLSRDYFDITFRGDRLTITAGKYVGLIPLNERVFIRVEPKVPVANLMTMLSAVEGEVVEMAALNRDYRGAPGAPTPQLLSAIASAFASALRKIEVEGLQKRYDPFVESGAFLKGQIRFNESVQRHWSHGVGYAAVSGFYDLTADIPDNRLLRYACHALLVHHQRTALLRNTIRDLDHFEEVFAKAGVSLEAPDLRARLVPIDRSPFYLRAVRLARMIASGQGIELRADGEDVSLPSFLIDMETLFEKYVRHVMSARLTGVEVLNGNTEGAKSLFDNRAAPPATPDVVVRRSGDYPLIGEVKYKAQESRDDRYQVLAYAVSYRARDIVLVLPAESPGSAGISGVGEVSGHRIHRYRFDLASADLDAEEGRFAAILEGLIRS